MSTPRFTGGDTLTGFARQVSDLLFLNEVNKNSAKVYSLSHAGTKSSGYSFGAVQWDLASRADIRDGTAASSPALFKLFENILENAQFPNGTNILPDPVDIQVILDHVKLRGNENALSQHDLALVNLALSSAYGVNAINIAHVQEINNIVSRVNATINGVTNADDRDFLNGSSAAQLFIADVNNNFGTIVNNKLKQFVQGQAVTPPGGIRVEKQGQKLGMDDLLAFYFSTDRAQTPSGLNDELRRFEGVIQTAGDFGVQSREEAEGVVAVVETYLTPKQGQLANYSAFISALEEPADSFLRGFYKKYISSIHDVFVPGRGKFGGDPIVGGDGSDLLLGDKGNDVLVGGHGDDVLAGGAGKDLYLFNTGDGHDVIVDNPTDAIASGDGGDGLGTIVYDEHVLGGGIHHTTDAANTFKSLDDQFTYQWDGIPGHDLTINGTLTVKDFTNGDLGITLANAPDIVRNFDNGGQTRTVFQKVDHYVQVGTDPDGNAILEPVFAPFFDEQSNDTRTTSDPGRLTQPIGEVGNELQQERMAA